MKRIVMGISFVLLMAAASLLPGRAQDGERVAATTFEQGRAQRPRTRCKLRIAALVPGQYDD